MSDPGGRVGGWSPGANAAVATSLVREVLAREGEAWVREATLSMSPLIRPGDEVRLVPLDRRRVPPGSLVAYRRQDDLVPRRVLARNEAGVVAKGDALGSPDPPVGWEEVVARVATLRRVGQRPADLEAFAWPAVIQALGVIAAIATRLPVEQGSAGTLKARGLPIPSPPSRKGAGSSRPPRLPESHVR